MPIYLYTALKPDGSVANGELTAGDRAEAMRRLDRSGMTPVSLKTKDDTAAKADGKSPKPAKAEKVEKPTETPAKGEKAEKKPSTPAVGKPEAQGKSSADEAKATKKPKADHVVSGSVRLSGKQIVAFTEEVSDLLGAGIQLEPALKIMEARDEVSSLKTVATGLRQRVRDGSSFSGALRAISPSFGELYCSMAAAGEISGALSIILKRQSEYLKSLQELQNRVIIALIYPAVLLLAGIGVSILFVSFLVPTLAAMLKKDGKELPFIAKAMMTGGDIFKHYWWLILGIILFSVWLFQTITTMPKYRERWDHFKLTLPFAGGLFRGRFYVQFLETLANLCENGLPLLRGLELTRDATVNLYLRGLLNKVIVMVGEGASLSKSIKRVGFFPSLLTDMINVGEQTGDLPLALRRTAERFDKELNKTIERVQALIPLVVIVFMAVMVGSVAYMMINVILQSITGMQRTG
jgi:general secretion pathway protein F